jgi:hypothetical protein
MGTAGGIKMPRAPTSLDTWRLPEALWHVKSGLIVPRTHTKRRVLANSENQKVNTGANKYLYVFGYRTPEQMALASTNENAEESSQALFIIAESGAQALEWGREISDQYVRQLFGDRPIDWKSMNFAHWVESEPQMEYPAAILEKLPVVNYGNYPDFKRFN